MARQEEKLRQGYRNGGWPAVWSMFLESNVADHRLRLRAYLALRRMDDVFSELGILEERNDAWMCRLEDSIYDPVRREPRFKALLKRLNYPKPM